MTLPARDNSRRRRFEVEIQPHLDSMRRTALRLTRSPADADDLVQDSVLKAYRFFDRYEPGTNIRAWLLKILTNLFFSKYRRTALENQVQALGNGDPVADGWMSASTMAARREPERQFERPLIEASIARALDDIPAEFREVLVLVDIEGLTYREVADSMGCPIGTVMSRLHRARRAVAIKLGVNLPAETGTEMEPVHGVVSIDAWRRRKEAVG